MFPKLVRNFIPKIIVQNDAKRVPHFYKAGDEEYWKRLTEKLLEEVSEFLESEDVMELADILEVVEAIIAFKKILPHEIDAMKKDKAQSHGTFSERIILSSVEEL